jgi:hypothetical protein
MTFTDVKLFIQNHVGLERDALHIHLALFLYLLATLLLRRGRRSVLPWLFVLGVEFANEVRDWLNVGQARRPEVFQEGVKDLWNTMLWPSILLLLGRYTSFFSWEPVPPEEEREGAVQLELPFDAAPASGGE